MRVCISWGCKLYFEKIPPELSSRCSSSQVFALAWKFMPWVKKKKKKLLLWHSANNFTLSKAQCQFSILNMLLFFLLIKKRFLPAFGPGATDVWSLCVYQPTMDAKRQSQTIHGVKLIIKIGKARTNKRHWCESIKKRVIKVRHSKYFHSMLLVKETTIRQTPQIIQRTAKKNNF